MAALVIALALVILSQYGHHRPVVRLIGQPGLHEHMCIRLTSLCTSLVGTDRDLARRPQRIGVPVCADRFIEAIQRHQDITLQCVNAWIFRVLFA